MSERLYNVIADVFNVPVADLRDDDNPECIESWTSLGHVNLVLSIEAEFRLSISPDDAVEFLTVGDIKRFVAEQTELANTTNE